MMSYSWKKRGASGRSVVEPLHRLERAQNVDHAVALEVALAAEVGRGTAENFLDTSWIAEELPVPREQEGDGTADVRCCHAGAILGLRRIARNRSEDLLPGCDEIRLATAVTRRATAGEVAHAIRVGLVTMRRPDRDHVLGVAGILNADGGVAFRGAARWRRVVDVALVPGGRDDDDSGSNDALALVAHRRPAARVVRFVVRDREAHVHAVDEGLLAVCVEVPHELERRHDRELVAKPFVVEHTKVVEVDV